jgi:hypothetical protein
MAKLKDVQFYTLHHAWHFIGWEIVAVTTEKSSQYFGRYVRDNSATHVRASECKGRFPTAEAAEARIAAVKLVKEKHKKPIELAKKALRQLEDEQERDVQAALDGKD